MTSLRIHQNAFLKSHQMTNVDMLSFALISIVTLGLINLVILLMPILFVQVNYFFFKFVAVPTYYKRKIWHTTGFTKDIVYLWPKSNFPLQQQNLSSKKS